METSIDMAATNRTQGTQERLEQTLASIRYWPRLCENASAQNLWRGLRRLKCDDDICGWCGVDRALRTTHFRIEKRAKGPQKGYAPASAIALTAFVTPSSCMTRFRL